MKIFNLLKKKNKEVIIQNNIMENNFSLPENWIVGTIVQDPLSLTWSGVVINNHLKKKNTITIHSQDSLEILMMEFRNRILSL